MITDRHASSDRRPTRVAARPLPSQWDADEILSLEEAARLFWPEGPLTVRSLRTAVRDGSLAVTWIAGKIYTTPRAIRDMTRCSKDQPGTTRASRREDPDPQPSAQPQPPPLSEAGQKLMRRIADEKAKLKPRLTRPR